ncbi:MAG: hypothetical protein KGD72_12515 [Candidatus Lokiarchaeota archaeon]|nr:hypothetical protein [Candidatus Lokiarchaeota archaeon]
MVNEKNEYYSSLEERKIRARKITIITFFLFILAVMALYGLIFNSYDVIIHLSWIFGVHYNQLFISFSKGFLLIFSCFTGIFLIGYLWKFVSFKRKLKHFLRVLQN